jgi:Universal stress protein family
MKSTGMSPHPSEHLEARAASEAAQGGFRKVLCGVDATPQSLAAVRQGDQLRAEGGGLVVVSALDTGATVQAGWAATQAAKGLRAEAHEAPCSVLVARERADGRELPRSIVVGVDGSFESAAAVAVGRALADRFQVDAQLLAVRNGKGFDQAAVDAIADDVRFEDGRPVEMLVRTAREDDLLIVGSRGLHGVRALGSVSERVAHKAHCSVLVVKPPKTP